MLGISLYDVLFALAAFGIAAFLIHRFVRAPYKQWGLWVLGIFAVIFLCERSGVVALLSSIRI